MKSEKIFEALRSVDEKLLERSERETASGGGRTDRAGRRRGFPKAAWTAAAAACLCLICVSLLWTGVWPRQGSAPPAAELAQPEGQTNGEPSGRPVDSAGAMAEELPEAAGGGSNEEPRSGSGAGGAAEPESAVNRVPADGDDEKEQTGTVENMPESQPQAFKEELLKNKAEDSAAPLELTAYASLQELLADEEFGSYVPRTVPERYTLESASKYQRDGRSVLSALWSCGLDTIHLSVDRKPDQPVAVTDVSKPETYDVNLYEIPYCDSVPQEYQASVFNPVFRREELDLEVVKARTRIVSDKGDTSTPRADFGVLYEDGTLVNVNARGTAEEIYALFSD